MNPMGCLCLCRWGRPGKRQKSPCPGALTLALAGDGGNRIGTSRPHESERPLIRPSPNLPLGHACRIIPYWMLLMGDGRNADARLLSV